MSGSGLPQRKAGCDGSRKHPRRYFTHVCRLSDVRDGGLKEGILRATVGDRVLKQVADDSQSQSVHHWSLCALQARWGLWCGSNVVG